MGQYRLSLFCLGLVTAASFVPTSAAPAASGLVIVTPDRFRPALSSYVKHKQQQLPTQLVSLESILKSAPGADDPEKLKHFLFDRWKRHHLGYVLLVGDADVMPVRFMVLDRITPAAFDYAFYPSDLYYANLAHEDGSFDDWNAQKDGFHASYFGEVRGEKNKTDPINYDNIYYRAQVAVGRWPVSSLAEVQTVATKTMAYEDGLLKGNRPGLHRAALFSVGGWVDSRNLLDELGKDLQPRWTVDERLYGDAARPSTTPPTEDQLDQILQEGVGLVCHAGHGSDDSWAGCFERRNLGKVKNADRLPVMISAGCSTARLCTLPPYEPYTDVQGLDHQGSDHGEVFKSPPPPPSPYQTGSFNSTGLGEQLLRAGPDGAVAYIGCDTGSQPCGLTLLQGFVQSVAHRDHPRLGDCWNDAIAWYWDKQHLATLKPNDDWYPPSIFFQGMKFLVFGDPSLLMPG